MRLVANADERALSATPRTAANCQLAAWIRELESCGACVKCDEHREASGCEVDDGGEDGKPKSDHVCSLNHDDNCHLIACDADTMVAGMSADLREVLAGVKRLIERNGFCVVCERYAPFHLIDCVVLKHK